MKMQIAGELARFGRLLELDAQAERKRADRHGDVLERGFVALKTTEIGERETECGMSVATTMIGTGASLVEQSTSNVDSNELDQAIRIAGELDRPTSSVAGDAADASVLSDETAAAIGQKLGPVGSSSELRSAIESLLDVPREA